LVLVAVVLGAAVGFAVGRWWFAGLALVLGLLPVVYFFWATSQTGPGPNIGAGIAALFGFIVVPPMLASVVGVVARKVVRVVRRSN
jgi:heme/copper-type cytochrome/quinol oxidase subunit 4